MADAKGRQLRLGPEANEPVGGHTLKELLGLIQAEVPAYPHCHLANEDRAFRVTPKVFQRERASIRLSDARTLEGAPAGHT